MNLLSLSLSLEHCNPLEERFLREDERREGRGAQRIVTATCTGLHPACSAVGRTALGVSMFFVGFHVNTLPVLPSLFLPFCLITSIYVCPESLLHSPLPSLVPFSPSHSSLPLLLVKLFPLSRELQVWTAGLGHR